MNRVRRFVVTFSVCFVLILGYRLWSQRLIEKEIAWNVDPLQTDFQVCVDGVCASTPTMIIGDSRHAILHVHRGHHNVGVKVCNPDGVCSPEAALDMDAK